MSEKKKKPKEDQKKNIFQNKIGISVDKKPSEKFAHLIQPDILNPINKDSSLNNNDSTTPDSLPDYCESDEDDITPGAKRQHISNFMPDSHKETCTSNNMKSLTSHRILSEDTTGTHPLHDRKRKVPTPSSNWPQASESFSFVTPKTISGPITPTASASSINTIKPPNNVRKASIVTPPSTTTTLKPVSSGPSQGKKVTATDLYKQRQTSQCERPSSSTNAMSSSGSSRRSSSSYQRTDTFSFCSPHQITIPSSMTSTVQHNRPQTQKISSSNKTISSIVPQMITKPTVTSSLFLNKKMQLIKEIVGVGKMDIRQEKSEIIITGMKNQVDVIIGRLEKEFAKFQSTLITEIFPVEAYYGPLFAENQFVKSLKDEFSGFEISLQCNTGKRIMSLDEVYQALNTQIEGRHDKIVILNDLYKLGLISRLENGRKQWFIQTFNGPWEPVPFKTNNIFNDHINAPMPITVKDEGNIYSVNLLEKPKATCTSTGFQHPLMNEAVWQYHVSGDQFCPYSLNESIQIEKCYNTFQCLPVQCENDRVCYFNFQSQLEIDITADNQQLNSIRRFPPISDTFPLFSVCFKGVKTEIKSAIDKFRKLLHDKINDRTVPVSRCKELFESHAQQYCIKTTSSTEKHISIRGIPQYVGLVITQLLDIVLNGPTSKSDINDRELFKVPEHWERQTNDIELKQVRMGSQEWLDIDKIWKRTMSSQPIKKLERIQNKYSWKAYCLCQDRIKTRNLGMYNEKWLFHGTSETSPDEIYKSEKGFDFRFSKSGFWGNGIYFAVNASYSAKKYSYTQFMTGDKQIFLAYVLTGDSVKLPNKDRSLKMPPLKYPMADNITRYDSVQGNTSGSDIYVVYEFDKAYPAYLITY